MAKDISEELYAKIKESFEAKYEKAQLLGEPLHDVLARIQNGGGTFRDADMYSVEVGSMLSDSLKENLILDEMPNKTFYRNIAKKTLGESLKDGYGMVSNIAAVVQEEMNASIGIGLKAVKPKLDVQAVDKIVNNAAQAETQDELDAVLTEPVKTFTRRVVDDTQKANARLHNKAGLEVKVEREYDGVGIHNQTEACQWCLDRADKFTYEEAMDKGVFERHEGCGCIITYTSKKGEVTRSTEKQGGFHKIESQEIKERDVKNKVEEKNKNDIIKSDGLFRTLNDPMVEVTGRAEDSNLVEVEGFIREIKESGCELIRREYEDLAYSPGLLPGTPGQVHISEGASYSAWVHEMSHMRDDRDAGWTGMRIFENPDEVFAREVKAYNLEIELAKQAGRLDIAKRLEANLEQERRQIYGINS